MDTLELVPRNKHDLERVNSLIAVGPEAAVPILEELLVWLQDINWPVARPLAQFLVSVGDPLLPHLRKILSSQDEMWIYWVLQYVVAMLPPRIVRELANELYSLATASENDHVAFCVGSAASVWDDAKLRHLLANKIRAYEEFLSELRAIQAALPEP
jgi:hypothetical protein